MPSFFVSYSRLDEARVRTLVDDVGALGHDVWFDQDLSGGQAWWDQILEQIRQCQIFVIALSPAALSSAACQREHGYAAALGKPILPVVVADGVSAALLPPALSQVQLVQYRGQDRSEAFRLARAVNALPATPPLPDPLPPSPEVPTSYLGQLAEKVDTANVLSYEEQTSLLVDLRRGMQDPSTRDDSRTLLARLRRRRDLFASIAEEIDGATARAAMAVPSPLETPRGTDATPHLPACAADLTASPAPQGPSPGLLLMTGPLGWIYALRGEPRRTGKLVVGTVLIFMFALGCFANGDGIDGYDDDIWEYLGCALIAASWTWPFAYRDLKSGVFTKRAPRTAFS